MKFTYAEGATPLNQDEIHNLIPRHLTAQSELDAWEQYNILKAESWAFRIKRKDILSISFVQSLHKNMFCDTWRWAGHCRKTQTNVGVKAVGIAPNLQILIGDARYWIEHKTYSVREIAVRLHHRLVLIHLFPNGNGRCSRLFADIFLANQGQEKFSWGRASLTNDSKTRAGYIHALQLADNADYTELIKFADS